MCEYCNGEKVMIEKEVLNPWLLMWMGVFRKEDIENGIYNLSMCIDRGYIRLVDKDDSECLEHGDKIKINYCPMCGECINE